MVKSSSLVPSTLNFLRDGPLSARPLKKERKMTIRKSVLAILNNALLNRFIAPEIVTLSEAKSPMDFVGFFGLRLRMTS